MNNNITYIFLRHAETKKDPSVNAFFWELSEKGKEESSRVSDLGIMQSVDIIYGSEEKKTRLTVEQLAKKLDKPIKPLTYFNEVKRGDVFLKKKEFCIEKEKQFQDIHYRAFGGESGYEALGRFVEGVTFVSKGNENKTVLIVSHGTIMNLYFAKLLNAQNTSFDRWNKTPFCAYGIVYNKKVIRDIIK